MDLGVIMTSIDTKRLYKAIHKFSELSVLVIGDLILDEYIYGDVDRISPEAPVQVVDVRHKVNVLGGAANVAHNIIDLGAKAYLAGIIGDDDNGELLEKGLREKGIDIEGVLRDCSRPTTKKTRIIAGGQHIIRLDQESRRPISPELGEKIIQYVRRNKPRFNSVIVSDYAKGVITDSLMRELINELKGIPILIDPKGVDFTKYKKATAITPNKKEALTASGMNDVGKAASRLLKELDLQVIFITLGKEGIFLLQKGEDPTHIPAIAKEVYDVSGAGDTVISSLCLSIASGLTYHESAFLANVAAGIVIGKLGTATVSRAELLSTLFFERPLILHKIVDIPQLIQTVGHLKSQGKKIVFTNGCFDIIHPGHIHLLKESRKLGDILVVAIDDDESVRGLKGAERPVLNQFQRAQIISSLDCVDYVVVFSTDELEELLSQLRPDVMTKGEDYSSKEIVGRKVVEQYGGRIVLISFLGDSSSSQIINRIIQNRGQR